MKQNAVKIALLALFFPLFCLADVKQNSPELVVHLLDYLANDYAGAVQDGQIVSQFEYDEQVEFSQIVEANAKGTEKLSADSEFMGRLMHLKILIDAKGSADEVAKIARELQQEAIQLSGIEVAPPQWPDLSRGAELYKMNCIACHGDRGLGDGPAGTGLDPKPSNFLDAELAWNSSPYKFYNTIRLGVPGTGMIAFPQLSDSDVWALAFYLKSLPYSEKGELPPPTDKVSLKDVATSTDAEIAEQLGGKSDETVAAVGALRSHSVKTENHDSLSVAEGLLVESLQAAKSEKFDEALKLAVRSYLEGIEPIEPKLRANAPERVAQIEALMIAYRSSLSAKAPILEIESKKNAVSKEIEEIRGLFADSKMSPAVAFGAAFSIFLREGFEAILIIVVLLSILKAMGQPQAVKWVHLGWSSAVGVGIIAWFASGLLLSMSGLSRELMEGAISLLAVVVLLYVGFWLHRYSEIRKWRAFLETKLRKGLSTGSYIGIALVAFMAVFREAFEVVLFLRAIWMDLDPSGQNVAGLGVLASLVVLVAIAYLAIRQSRKIPLGLLFQICSWTMIILAVILAGKGVHSLQEAGLVPVSDLFWMIRMDFLGIYPNLQTMTAQILAILVFGGLLLREKHQH